MKKKKKSKLINKFIPKTQTEQILSITFILLLILVIVLSIIALNLKHEHNSKKDMNLVIPMLEKEANNTFLVDLSKMKKDEIK